MDNLGAIAGPLLAIVLVAAVGIRSAILLSVIPGLLAAAAIVYAIRHLPRPKTRHHQPFHIRFRQASSGGLGPILAGIGAFEAGNLAATLMILRATELLAPAHGTKAATEFAIALYVGYNAAATVASVPAGRAVDRLGGIRVMTWGSALFGVAYIGFAVAGANALFLAACFVGAGVAIGLVETAEHSTVASLAPENARGSAFGLLAALQSFGNLAASAVAGLLWTLVSPVIAFCYAALWMLIATVVLATARRARLSDA
jgi:MFS family permease